MADRSLERLCETGQHCVAPKSSFLLATALSSLTFLLLEGCLRKALNAKVQGCGTTSIHESRYENGNLHKELRGLNSQEMSSHNNDLQRSLKIGS